MPVQAHNRGSTLSRAGPPPTIEARVIKPETAGQGRDLLLTRLMPLVRQMALKMREHLPAHIEVDDLVGAGALGLVDAIRKFDPAKRVRLEKYATLRIRGAMLDGLRDLDVASRDLRRKSKRVEKVYREMQSKLGRPVDDQEMAEALHISLKEWYHTAQEIQALGADWLRPMILGSAKRLREEGLPSADQESQFDHCYLSERRKILNAALGCLSKRERMIITLYYNSGLTMKRIASRLGIDESRVSQLHSAALVRLRSLVKAKTKSRRG